MNKQEYEANTDTVITLNYAWIKNNYGALLTSFALNKLLDITYNKQPIVVNNDFIKYKTNEKKYTFSDNFRKKYFKFTKHCATYYDFFKLNTLSNIFITGSDQVFRLPGYNDKFEYLLSFVSPTHKKIAFSASFAIDKKELLNTTDKRVIEKAKLLFNGFDYISVREKSAVDIMKNIFNIDAEWIIDPVFILDKTIYNKLIENSSIDYSNQIISYVLDSSKDYEKAYKFLEKKFNTKVIKTANSNIPVENWLASIKDCKFLITDSFHGLCFAIIFNKPFICITNKKRGATRFDSILEMLNIENQCINNINEIYKKNCIFDIDYEKVNKRIFEETQKGLRFLKKALDSPTTKIQEKLNVKMQFLEDNICILEKEKEITTVIKKYLWEKWLIIFYHFPKIIQNLILSIKGKFHEHN